MAVFVVSTVNCLSTNYVLSLAILITSNFSFSTLFASLTLAQPLKKILAGPLYFVQNNGEKNCTKLW